MLLYINIGREFSTIKAGNIFCNVFFSCEACLKMNITNIRRSPSDQLLRDISEGEARHNVWVLSEST
jgi:hypothetical protein